jgi:hypothetical protein
VYEAVLDALARALQLDEVEREHLIHLAQVLGAGAVPRQRPARKQVIRASAQLVLDSVTNVPAVIRSLVSLVGVVGAIAGAQVGRFHDRGHGVLVIGVGLFIVMLGLIVSGAGTGVLAIILTSVAIFSIGVQDVQVLSRTRMLSSNPAARSRLNTVFVVGNFIGGAIGPVLASIF